MWKVLISIVCVGSAMAAPVPKDFKKPDDKVLLVGTWTMTRCNVSGKDQNPSWRTLTFDADGAVRASQDGRQVFEYFTTLDQKATPKRMPWRNKPPGTSLYECVYQLTADLLTISVPHDNKTPPTSLEIGPRVTVYEFKRAEKK